VLTLILLRNPASIGSDFVLPREDALSAAYLAGLGVAVIIMWISVRKHWAQRQDQ
jgi:hypothetical protein